ncbi:hypothetical protein H6504_04140 [Candidatus Woesearchaeota archaeon]|nr:hypothetical protein [Candidatus Woesearchaeota archaeon]
MIVTTLPNSISLTAGDLFDMVHEHGFDPLSDDFKVQLHTLVYAYDDHCFRSFMSKFQETYSGHKDADHFGSNISIIEQHMDELRHLERYLRVGSEPQIPLKVRRELPRHVGGVYTRLEVLAMHANQVQFNYRSD